eukprot:CCRYP_001908-RA/>CCRYP_001908-RA protein AED:0.02 eAED:0.02 QI:172/1/1/1/1/1/2/278/786
MFQKSGSSSLGGKKDAPLRKSDRRKLRDRAIAALFIGEASTGDDWIARAEKLIDDAIVAPKSGDVLCRKLKLSSGEHATLFLRTPSAVDGQAGASNAVAAPSVASGLEGLLASYPVSWPYHQTTQPILLEYEDFDRKLHLIPLLGLLSALPPPSLSSSSSPTLVNTAAGDEPPSAPDSSGRKYRIPNIEIHPNVSKYICRGADLMKSGIRSFPPPWELRQSKGVVAVSVRGNPCPLAVGCIENTLMREYCYGKNNGRGNWREDACRLVGPMTKGVGVVIVNCYGDDLWKSSLPPKGMGSFSSSSFFAGVCNPLGGGTYDDGNYGNVGFRDGSIACPILQVGEEDDMSSEDDNDDNDADATQPTNVHDVPEEGHAIDFMETLNISDQVIEQEEMPSSVEINENEMKDEEIPDTDHNDILRVAFYTSLIQLLVSKTPLPIPVSIYFAKHLLAAIPPSGPRLDMKQTTWKKIGPFLLDMESKGVIKLGPSKDGKDRCAFLVGIEKQHRDMVDFKRQWRKEMEQNGQDIATIAESATKKKLAVVDLYIVPRHISEGMQLKEEDVKAMNAKTEERKGTGFLTKTECRSLIDNYIESEGLVDPNGKGKILINGPLCDALYRPSKKNKSPDDKNAGFPTSVPRKDLIDRWIEKMDRGHALVEMPGSKILFLARGEPKPVDIEVEFRQGNKKKFLTRLRGMEDYGIEAEPLSNDVSHRFACSSTIETNPVGRPALRKGRVELVFQGHLSEELTALLTGDDKLTAHGGAKGAEYNLPKSVVKVSFRKGVPARKKR